MKKGKQLQWGRVDLHIHTPASACYAEPNVTYLDILRRAGEKGLDIIAITDHNTVAGCAAMSKEMEELMLLERLNRLRAKEKQRLEEYRRLGDKILVLPGFEFTATLGFHILGIFSEKTSTRELEYILLDLNIPPDKLDAGSTEVGATTDVLTAYRIIDEAGGLVIAAHANSSHGVALQGLDFGGQTKIAYTQDPHLHALEVTDLEKKGQRTTASFYRGSKPEYPRRMHCIQGSDSHRLNRDPRDRNALGVGDRVTEVLLPEVSFETLKAVFLGDDFARTRPYRPAKAPFDHVRAAREQGPNIVLSFHESIAKKGGRLHAIVCDVVAFANANGGVIYVGARADPKVAPVGINNPEETIGILKAEIQRRVTPPLDVSIDSLESEGKKIIRLVVPKGSDVPYAVDGSKIYVRSESETSLALRDEVVQLVQQRLAPPQPEAIEVEPGEEEVAPQVEPPRTGVEIVDTVERKGTLYHTVKDLRNGNVVQNVTRSSARKLWRYAITQREQTPVKSEKITWHGDIGFWKTYKRGGKVRYNLAQRDPDGKVHIYYGVTEEGFHGEWRRFLKGE
ncbi:MAG: transcriptional regulator [Anaerolineales bacterium]|nr:MAG: transcriptional regulator [Anaerolineales bacterium]